VPSRQPGRTANLLYVPPTYSLDFSVSGGCSTRRTSPVISEQNLVPSFISTFVCGGVSRFRVPRFALGWRRLKHPRVIERTSPRWKELVALDPGGWAALARGCELRAMTERHPLRGGIVLGRLLSAGSQRACSAEAPLAVYGTIRARLAAELGTDSRRRTPRIPRRPSDSARLDGLSFHPCALDKPTAQFAPPAPQPSPSSTCGPTWIHSRYPARSTVTAFYVWPVPSILLFCAFRHFRTSDCLIRSPDGQLFLEPARPHAVRLNRSNGPSRSTQLRALGVPGARIPIGFGRTARQLFPQRGGPARRSWSCSTTSAASGIAAYCCPASPVATSLITSPRPADRSRPRAQRARSCTVAGRRGDPFRQTVGRAAAGHGHEPGRSLDKSVRLCGQLPLAHSGSAAARLRAHLCGPRTDMRRAARLTTTTGLPSWRSGTARLRIAGRSLRQPARLPARSTPAVGSTRAQTSLDARTRLASPRCAGATARKLMNDLLTYTLVQEPVVRGSGSMTLSPVHAVPPPRGGRRRARGRPSAYCWITMRSARDGRIPHGRSVLVGLARRSTSRAARLRSSCFATADAAVAPGWTPPCRLVGDATERS